MIARQVTLFPQPDSPTIPNGLPGLDSETDAINSTDDAVGGEELGM